LGLLWPSIRVVVWFWPSAPSECGVHGILRVTAWQKKLVFFSGLLVLRSCWLPWLLHVSAAFCLFLFVAGTVATDGGIDGANVLTVDVCIAAVDGGVGGTNV